MKRSLKLPGAKWTMTEIELRTMPILMEGLDRAEVIVDGVPLKDFKLKKDKESVWVEVYGYHKNVERWLAAQRFGVDIIKSAVDVEDEPDRRNVLKGFYPRAEIVDIGMPVRWKTDPVGLVIHFTAGWDNKESDALAALKLGKKNGYTYAAMSRSGKIYMDVSVEEQGYHAGHRAHRNKPGIEICNAGKLSNQGVSWFGRQFPESQIRRAHSKDNVIGGAYQKFSLEQESELVRYCLWLNEAYESFSIDEIVGHDTISSHKNDPGGSLSRTIPEFQAFLKDLWAKGFRWDNYEGE